MKISEIARKSVMPDMICGACSCIAKPEQYSGGLRYRCVKCGRFSVTGLEKKRKRTEVFLEKWFSRFDKTIDRLSEILAWFPDRFRKSFLNFHRASWKVEDAFTRLEKAEDRIHNKNQLRAIL